MNTSTALHEIELYQQSTYDNFLHNSEIQDLIHELSLDLDE